jgi:hypothetical protein
MCDGEDPSHVISALKDAVRNAALDEDRLMALAKVRQGFPYSQDVPAEPPRVPSWE